MIVDVTDKQIVVEQVLLKLEVLVCDSTTNRKARLQ